MSAHVTLPLPEGNLSNFDDPWAWIENDMLPAYRDVLAQPGGAEAIVQRPVDDRAGEFRKFPASPTRVSESRSRSYRPRGARAGRLR